MISHDFHEVNNCHLVITGGQPVVNWWSTGGQVVRIRDQATATGPQAALFSSCLSTCLRNVRNGHLGQLVEDLCQTAAPICVTWLLNLLIKRLSVKPILVDRSTKNTAPMRGKIAQTLGSKPLVSACLSCWHSQDLFEKVQGWLQLGGPKDPMQSIAVHGLVLWVERLWVGKGPVCQSFYTFGDFDARIWEAPNISSTDLRTLGGVRVSTTIPGTNGHYLRCSDNPRPACVCVPKSYGLSPSWDGSMVASVEKQGLNAATCCNDRWLKTFSGHLGNGALATILVDIQCPEIHPA